MKRENSTTESAEKKTETNVSQNAGLEHESGYRNDLDAGNPVTETEHGREDKLNSASEQTSLVKGLFIVIGLLLSTFSFLVFVSTFGIKTRNPNDQGFLYGVIVVQILILVCIVYLQASAASLSSSRIDGVLKAITVGALCFVLCLLSMCSVFAQYGWQGG
jgi:hypothetical protein